jgi:hypothetical protein
VTDIAPCRHAAAETPETLMNTIHSCTRTTLMAALCIAAVGLTAGCYWPGYYPGGSQASRDLYTFESATDYPQSIQLRDLTTREVLWSINVPIGQQVVIRFYDGHDPRNEERPALMRWELMERGTRFGELGNAIPVPRRDRRLMEVFIRDRDVAPGLETAGG